ncbi:hypothetical protein Ahy_B04g072123 isoform B [Arachis hypogaea]|uniref:Uncharacterized protein n=1 Tax=Arachis hypogaea TaxID=3818 RepID=A0A444ZML1_ARAHY|nr:hypothetical protein Ahy_B04g072123 isoform B [Arachis hypogaea]
MITTPHLTSPSACRLLSPLVTPTLFLAVSLSLEDSLPLLHLAGFTVCPSTSSSWLRVSRRRRRVSCVTAAVPPLRRCCGAASPSLESASSRFYPGVSDALKFASSRVYIVTTKQEIHFPCTIFGFTGRPKVEVLKQLQKRPEHQGLTLQELGLQHSEREREEAAAIPRIQVLKLSDFSKKLK